MNKSESKYFRTAARMDEAFLSLLEHKDLAYITVKEICEKAGVNRSTFYLHYETIGDLLAESVAYMHGRFLERFSGADDVGEKIRRGTKQELLLLTPAYLTPYLSFIRENRSLYRSAMQKPEIFSADETYQKMFRHIFDPILARFSVPEAERSWRMVYYLSGIAAVIAEWLRTDCAESIEALSDIIRRCILPQEIT